MRVREKEILQMLAEQRRATQQEVLKTLLWVRQQALATLAQSRLRQAAFTQEDRAIQRLQRRFDYILACSSGMPNYLTIKEKIEKLRSVLPPYHRLQENQNLHQQSKAVRRKEGWIWFDKFGKIYGPFKTKREAELVGPEHAIREEKTLRRG